MSAAKLNIDELEAGYPLFCKALRLLILKGNSVKDIEKTVCWSHLETLIDVYLVDIKPPHI